jgi:UDP-N-acetylmuramate dehydrogenase
MSEALGTLLKSGAAREHVPLGPMTTYKSGGPARYLVEVDQSDTLSDLIQVRQEIDLPILVLGRGSNLLVADAGFEGLVVHLGPGFGAIEIRGEDVVAGGAAPLAQVARAAAGGGLGGLEFFVGIPGSVGGAIRQNAGCFGVETNQALVEATLLDLRTGITDAFDASALDLSYRHSNLRPDQIVIRSTFGAHPADPESSREEMRRITRWRRDNQPGGTFNAGSVFKNPSHVTAGELIDSLGLKGLSVGEVAVSAKHANFFVAGPGATSGDIRELVGRVKDRVFQMTGTMLEPEIQFVGFPE